MSRTIDADALLRKICGAKCGCEYEDCGNEGDCEFDHFIFHAPTIQTVPLADIYMVIAGHSNYHGDAILAALTCIAEGKQVNAVKPLETETGRHGRWIEDGDCQICSECGAEHSWIDYRASFCEDCGAKMDKEADDGTTD